jgi:hypothetical protein
MSETNEAADRLVRKVALGSQIVVHGDDLVRKA